MTVTPVASSPTPTPTKVVKPGYLTTEFWLTALAQLFLTLNTAGVWHYVHPAWASMVVQGAVLGLYSLSRGWAKSG